MTAALKRFAAPRDRSYSRPAFCFGAQDAGERRALARKTVPADASANLSEEETVPKIRLCVLRIGYGY